MTDPADAAQQALQQAGMHTHASAIKALQAVARVQALHQPYPSLASRTDRRTCAHCNGIAGYAVSWPCDTIRALNGEQP